MWVSDLPQTQYSRIFRLECGFTLNEIMVPADIVWNLTLVLGDTENKGGELE